MGKNVFMERKKARRLFQFIGAAGFQISCAIAMSVLLYGVLYAFLTIAQVCSLVDSVISDMILWVVRHWVLPLFVLWSAANALEQYDNLRERLESMFLTGTFVAVGCAVQLTVAIMRRWMSLTPTDALFPLLLIVAWLLIFTVIVEPKLWYTTRRKNPIF